MGSTPGAPDAWLVYRGQGRVRQVEGWLEFKMGGPDGRFQVRPAQWLWHEEQLRHTRNVAFCVVNDQGFYLVPSRAALREGAVGPDREFHAWDGVATMRLPELVGEAFALNDAG